MVSQTGDALPTPEMLDRLAAFLRELTGGLHAAYVHAAITEQSELADHDPRVDLAIADPDEFAAIWSALTVASLPPPGAWESVVLPAVVAFSTEANLKVHLELATSLWVAGTHAADTLAEQSTQHLDQTEVGADTMRLSAPESARSAVIAEPEEPPATARSRRRVGLLAIVTAGVFVIALVAALLWWTSGKGTPSTSDSSRARAPIAVSPSRSPELTPSADPVPVGVSTLPAPAPTWTGPGPAVAPGAPSGLVVIDITMNSISLSWQAPSSPGTGGIAYYRITVDGNDAGWTTPTSVKLTGLTPDTTYTVTVIAFNNAGLSSSPSNAATATTSSPPSPQPPPTPTAAVAPASTLTLGDSFTVSGTNWICDGPAQVEVLLQGQVVAQATTDAAGAFTVSITVMNDGLGPYVVVIGSGAELALTAGKSTLHVRFALGQPQCTTEFNVPVQITFT